MVNFCPGCDNLLIKTVKEGKTVLRCKSCGYTELFTKKTIDKDRISAEKMKVEKEKEIFSPADMEIYPTTKIECEKCGNKEAEYWQSQTRSADEASTTFFRCKKCKFTWREY